MEMQSIVVPPRQEYLDGFRALHHALAPSGPADVLASLAVIAVLPGLCEELVVRGVLLPSLVAGLLSSFERMGRSLNPEYGATSRSRVSAGATHGAVLMSAVLFAAMHADPYRFLFTLTIGLVLGVLRLRTGSLWSPVAAHVTLNALTFFVAPLVDDPSQPYTPQPVLGLLCLVAGAAVAGPLLRALRPSVDSPQAAA
jgi:membrane protease YdiL (CAAX protease family)